MPDSLTNCHTPGNADRSGAKENETTGKATGNTQDVEKSAILPGAGGKGSSAAPPRSSATANRSRRGRIAPTRPRRNSRRASSSKRVHPRVTIASKPWAPLAAFLRLSAFASPPIWGIRDRGFARSVSFAISSADQCAGPCRAGDPVRRPCRVCERRRGVQGPVDFNPASRLGCRSRRGRRTHRRGGHGRGRARKAERRNRKSLPGDRDKPGTGPHSARHPRLPCRPRRRAGETGR